MKGLAVRTHCLAFASVQLALSYEAGFGRAVERLAFGTNCVAFTRLRHGGADNGRSDQSNKNNTRCLQCTGQLLFRSDRRTVFDLGQIQDRYARTILDA